MKQSKWFLFKNRMELFWQYRIKPYLWKQTQKVYAIRDITAGIYESKDAMEGICSFTTDLKMNYEDCGKVELFDTWANKYVIMDKEEAIKICNKLQEENDYKNKLGESNYPAQYIVVELEIKLKEKVIYNKRRNNYEYSK